MERYCITPGLPCHPEMGDGGRSCKALLEQVAETGLLRWKEAQGECRVIWPQSATGEQGKQFHFRGQRRRLENPSLRFHCFLQICILSFLLFWSREILPSTSLSHLRADHRTTPHEPLINSWEWTNSQSSPASPKLNTLLCVSPTSPICSEAGPCIMKPLEKKR